MYLKGTHVYKNGFEMIYIIPFNIAMYAAKLDAQRRKGSQVLIQAPTLKRNIFVLKHLFTPRENL